MIEESCGGCAQTDDEGGAAKMRQERQWGEQRMERSNGAALRPDKVIVKLHQTTCTNDGFSLICCIWGMM